MTNYSIFFTNFAFLDGVKISFGAMTFFEQSLIIMI